MKWRSHIIFRYLHGILKNEKPLGHKLLKEEMIQAIFSDHFKMTLLTVGERINKL